MAEDTYAGHLNRVHVQELEHFVELHNTKLELFVLTMFELYYKASGTSMFVVLFKQLVWGLVNIIESKLMKCPSLVDDYTHSRPLDRMPSDIDSIVISDKPIYDPKNKRHTTKELCRYIAASKFHFHGAQFLTFGGPDGSKIGTDLSLVVGAIGDSETMKVGVCVPQVLFYFTGVQCMGHMSPSYIYIYIYEGLRSLPPIPLNSTVR